VAPSPERQLYWHACYSVNQSGTQPVGNLTSGAIACLRISGCHWALLSAMIRAAEIGAVKKEKLNAL
jgi:thiol:disulfide interchange protein